MAPRRISTATVRDRSKDVFRNRYMLEICAAIDREDDRVSLSSLLEGTGLAPSLYSGPLRRLARVGLLLDDPRTGDDHRSRWYRPAPSHLWVAARELTQ